MKQERPYPKVIVMRKAAKALAGGHPWVFEGEVVRTEPSSAGAPVQNGGLVDVFEENGTWQGAGLISSQSRIRVRVVTRNANDRMDEDFWRRRLRWAWEHRVTTMGSRALPGCEPDTNCCRVIFSEADGLPGLVVDRYEDVLVSQVGTVGMIMRMLKMPDGRLKVLVQGRIHYTKWTDAAGVDRYGCEIIAEKVDFLSRPKSAENENPELVDRDDEIPF